MGQRDWGPVRFFNASPPEVLPASLRLSPPRLPPASLLVPRRMGLSCPPLPRGPVPLVAWSLCPRHSRPFPWRGISKTS
eukprot:13064325-Heterocapsa_arctica.AAC.1